MKDLPFDKQGLDKFTPLSDTIALANGNLLMIEAIFCKLKKSKCRSAMITNVEDVLEEFSFKTSPKISLLAKKFKDADYIGRFKP